MNTVRQIGSYIHRGLGVIMCGGMLLGYAVGVVSCAEQERWYVSVHFMSEGYGYNTVHYSPGDYVSVETHTPIVFDFPETIDLLVTTDEGDREILTATWVEDPSEPDYYVHRACIKMIAPEDPVIESGFIETHVNALIIAEYSTSDDTAVDTAYVVSSD
ncbi:hypothetical protein JXB22_07700 [candidate division WOR-3 bacterium]|nr:hypothetical protein [candidate division WOR-3 bacterium]